MYSLPEPTQVPEAELSQMTCRPRSKTNKVLFGELLSLGRICYTALLQRQLTNIPSKVEFLNLNELILSMSEISLQQSWVRTISAL